MSSLREGRSYGLSSGEVSGGGGGGGGKLSVLHLKLTDSAARAFGTFQHNQGCSARATICFNGDQGKISVPCSDSRDDVRVFTFDVTNVARNNPNGSFDCVQQLQSGSTEEELSSLGVIQKKMTVNATDDSYDKARQSMAQAEEETRSHGAIVIKHGGRYQGKKVTVRAPAPALAGLTKPKHQSSPSVLHTMKKGAGLSKLKKGACALNRRILGNVQQRPLKERLIHLLALRPYKRPELILRLQRDGLSAEDKDTLDTVVKEVGQINSRDNTFILRDGLYKDLQKDWPGYSTGDQQLLKRILVRRLFQPQQNLLTAPEAQVSPLRDTPNSSPAHRPKPPLPEEYTDPLVSKKPRISHLSSAADRSRPRPSETPPSQKDAEARADDGRRNLLDPRKLLDPQSAAGEQDHEAAKRLEPVSCLAQEEEEPRPLRPDPDRSHSPLTAPHRSKQTTKRKKSKHKHRSHEKKRRKEGKEKREESSSEEVLLGEPRDLLFEAETLEADTVAPDYLSKYTSICSHEQRQSYKQDFNKEYSEYRDLHARIDGVTRQFMELDGQLKQLHQESHKYKTVRNKILQEYRKIKKSNPNYSQDKIHCERLHSKLAHIKKLISDYDNQQLVGHS